MQVHATMGRPNVETRPEKPSMFNPATSERTPMRSRSEGPRESLGHTKPDFFTYAMLNKNAPSSQLKHAHSIMFFETETEHEARVPLLRESAVAFDYSKESTPLELEIN